MARSNNDAAYVHTAVVAGRLNNCYPTYSPQDLMSNNIALRTSPTRPAVTTVPPRDCRQIEVVLV